MPDEGRETDLPNLFRGAANGHWADRRRRYSPRPQWGQWMCRSRGDLSDGKFSTSRADFPQEGQGTFCRGSTPSTFAASIHAGALLPCLELLIISDDGVARPASECPDRLPALALE